MEKANKTSWEELRQRAIETYYKMAGQYGEYNSFIEDAIDNHTEKEPDVYWAEGFLSGAGMVAFMAALIYLILRVV